MASRLRSPLTIAIPPPRWQLASVVLVPSLPCEAQEAEGMEMIEKHEGSQRIHLVAKVCELRPLWTFGVNIGGLVILMLQLYCQLDIKGESCGASMSECQVIHGPLMSNAPGWFWKLRARRYFGVAAACA